MKANWLIVGLLSAALVCGCAKSAEPEAEASGSNAPESAAPALDPPPLAPDAGGEAGSSAAPSAVQESPRGEELSINPAGGEHRPGSR
ncbi:hypothetical protein QPK87_13835 [Kamptonema cortianum]|nr:hypothetical protein [Geitlerinema splendidum]MDK3157649.1 hypothetical protein [Kamptonema cortianum]